MSKTSYYYDPPGTLAIVYAPGELCDLCGELGRICRAGELLPIPLCTGMEEYGHSAGNIHGHLECVVALLEQTKQEVKELDAAVVEYRRREQLRELQAKPITGHTGD